MGWEDRGGGVRCLNNRCPMNVTVSLELVREEYSGAQQGLMEGIRGMARYQAVVSASNRFFLPK